jgi:hypothetical protein
MLMSPYHYDGYLDPTSMENRIWGDFRLQEHDTCLSYCYCTCDLNILGTHMESSFSLSQNGV